jgi:hypothetical protein
MQAKSLSRRAFKYFIEMRRENFCESFEKV